ncbi:hypothetical protein [Winogradskyella sp.]|uniref:hypothetical protein n=1 Tax=Winogradskyella sp. TaxID=1883156 RepID=UPI003F6B8830
MNRYLYLLLFLLIFTCNNERIVQLPEIENAEITEVLDVSPAYIFYDETQPDSTLLNRRNLISTTNWLVNVDKRLTLRQAIPHIKFLQDKKRNAEMHKNEEAKNYFTCNDTSIKNLGFIEFTNVNYVIDIDTYTNNEPVNTNIRTIYIHFLKSDVFIIDDFFEGKQIKSEGFEMKIHFNENFFAPYRNHKNEIELSFDERLSFQKYIEIKHNIMNFTNDMSIINNEEFIY